ncbi:OLC1v1008168C1 [Oldenlandia corymbosa var. corymbosa]|uniref:OLC1v1008168C1 n=1 Tax=Oldenlandia corymbosa var. corymbosa TaxID=529605 RepID=A0AAV1DP60_OLDCO|nr:OLC1v1008168C1 [Oldenlandia corymbosa var. corymbosa]
MFDAIPMDCLRLAELPEPREDANMTEDDRKGLRRTLLWLITGWVATLTPLYAADHYKIIKHRMFTLGAVLIMLGLTFSMIALMYVETAEKKNVVRRMVKLPFLVIVLACSAFIGFHSMEEQNLGLRWCTAVALFLVIGRLIAVR